MVEADTLCAPVLPLCAPVVMLFRVLAHAVEASLFASNPLRGAGV